MKLKITYLFLLIPLLFTTNSYSQIKNQCMDLFNIHLGYNAFTNITHFSIGLKPDLQYCDIIYKNFPNDNEQLKTTSKFLMEYAIKNNHPSIDSILAENNYTNGQFLSYLSLISKYEGSADYREYYKKLGTNDECKNMYFQTIIYGYPMRWDKNYKLKILNTTALEFIKQYDFYLSNNNQLSESELMLYNLFKIEIEFEASNNEGAFLSQLESLLKNHKNYFSIKKYNQFIQKYFPNYKTLINSTTKINDDFDVDNYGNDNNKIFSSYVKKYNSLKESMIALEKNPFNNNVATYTNVRNCLPKENFESILSSLEQLELIESKYTKVSKIPAIGFDLIKIILEEVDENRFTKTQQNELKFRLLKKWLDFHIALNSTMTFYMDKILINYWNDLSKEDQIKLMEYFTKELESSGNHDYLLALNKVLKLK